MRGWRHVAPWLWSVGGVLIYLGYIRAARRLFRASLDAPQANCFLYAAGRFYRDGGRVIFEQSRYTPILHVSYEDPQGQEWEYNPPEKHTRSVRSLLGEIVFPGTVTPRTRAEP